MPENNLGFHEPLPVLRPRWITNLCIILGALAHIFGILSFIFLIGALYEDSDYADQINAAAGQTYASSGTMISISDAAAHQSQDWGLAAGSVFVLLVLSAWGLWRMKIWGLIPFILLALVSLPWILSWPGFNLQLFK